MDCSNRTPSNAGCSYRDNRNTTAHDYGERFAEATLALLPGFIADAQALADIIDAESDD